MQNNALTRWQQFYLDDPALQAIPPSSCAERAVRIFAANNSRLLLDLGCGTGRDSLHLMASGSKVIGLDAARSGLLLARKRVGEARDAPWWVESDSRFLPFRNAVFDGVYCFGLLHEFVGEGAEAAVIRTMTEIRRVLKASGAAIIATAAGDPEKGLPHVQNFSEAMFDAVTAGFHCLEKKVFEDLGCTGRKDYRVWFGHFSKG